MRRQLVVLLTALAVVVVGAGVAVAAGPVGLRTDGPTEVVGTEASAVFTIGDRTIRQVRYHDGQTLGYTFTLSNDGPVTVAVDGLADLGRTPRLFAYQALLGPDGEPGVRVPAGESVRVTLTMRMHGCETLSARAGSFASHVALATTRAGFLDQTVTLELPEEVHTGSPREAACPGATAGSRSRG